MPELVFHTGPMDCGKSTLALQLDHTQSTHGRQGRIFTSRDRSGRARISSRLGLETPATEVDEEFDFWTHVIAQLVAGRRIDYLVCDEAQFYTGEQVEQLARVVDELQIDVYTFGILADFRTKLFPGSRPIVLGRCEGHPQRPHRQRPDGNGGLPGGGGGHRSRGDPLRGALPGPSPAAHDRDPGPRHPGRGSPALRGMKGSAGRWAAEQDLVPARDTGPAAVP